MKIISFAFLLFLLIGCKETPTYATEFIDDNWTKIRHSDQVYMCNQLPDSIFCQNSPTTGDIQPTEKYVKNIVSKLKPNTKYVVSDNWHYTETVYEYQERDCEDEAMTMVHHMVDDGIDKKYLFLVYILMPNNTAHVFVGVDTVDKGLLHMDLSIVTPIEPKINWHMRMDDAGVEKWVKGNIILESEEPKQGAER